VLRRFLFTDRNQTMSQPPRWRGLALALAPIWLSQFDRWQQRRARERQRAQRILDRMANGEPISIDTPSPEPREPRDVDTIFRRLNHRRQQQSWIRYADELGAERRRTVTNYRDSFR
jgi:hypothetical protein